MPLYYYLCGSCKKPQRRLLTPEESQAPLPCSCGGALARTPVPPSSQAVETLDNGIMTKRLERLADAETLFRERNEAVKKSRGE